MRGEILMTNEKIYLEMLNRMREGAYFVNIDKEITIWNKAVENITGYKKEEVLQMKCQNTPLKHVDGEGKLICEEGCSKVICLHKTLYMLLLLCLNH